MNLTAVIVVAVALALPGGLLLAALLGSRRKRARLGRLTATGSATVVAMTATTVAVGHQPVVKFRMRLQFGEGGKDEEIELSIAIHPLSDERVQIGTVLPLRFEPGQTANYSIDLGGVTGVTLSDF
jgi:hypothetical protein